MNAKKCDRCGKFYEGKEEIKPVELFVRDQEKSYRKLSSIDLCPTCREDLLRWLKND